MHGPVAVGDPPRSLAAAFAAVMIGALVCGCAGSGPYAAALAGAGLDTSTIAGQPFQHVLYARLRDDGVLHVYLDGDGTPWIRDGRKVATDPGPKTTVVPELIARDPASVLLLGRPCYHGMARSDPACHPLHWTFLRYGPTVVGSLEQALLGYLGRVPDGATRRLVLIGFSGGGVLAILLAERLKDRIDGLVTLAAPLDTDAWTRYHGYTALRGSLNPSPVLKGLDTVPQRHHFGAVDPEVPPGLVTRPAPQVKIHAGFDHRCCWTRIWPQALEELTLAR